MRIVLVGIFYLLLCGNARAQDSLNVTKMGEMIFWHKANDLVISGNYAYVAAGGAGLHIVDVSDPAAPFEVGYCETPGYARSLTISGDYAYIADQSGGLRILDISDPVEPTEIGFCTPASVNGVAVAGNFAYLTCGSSAGLWVVDISNPTLPLEVGHWEMVGSMFAVEVFNDYAYVAAGGADLKIIDVSDPTTPVLVDSCEVPGTAWDVTISTINGDYAFVACHGLAVFSLSDPAAPDSISHLDGFIFKAVVVSQDYAYIANGGYGWHIADISNIYSPVIISSLDTPVDALGIGMTGNVAYITDSFGGLQIFDVSIPTDPAELNSFGWGVLGNSVAIEGDLAYVANAYLSLRIINVSDPTSPFDVSNYPLPGSAIGVDVSEGYAYVACGSAGFRVLDISTPASPFDVSYIDIINENPQDVAISSDMAFVAVWYEDAFGYWWGSLWITDVVDPENPVILSSINWDYPAFDVEISGDYAYVAAWVRGMRIVDISDPNAPYEVSYYDPGQAWDIALSGSYAYVATVTNGFRIVNIENPSNPIEVGYCPIPGYPYDVALAGNYAIVADYNWGVWVVCVENPEDPVLVGHYETPGNANDVAILADYFCVCDGYYFGIYDYSAVMPVEAEKTINTPTTYALLPPYPNPFNPTTMLSFQLPAAGRVKLDIFDIKGCRVGIGLEPTRQYPPGTHHILFDGSGLPSGIYLARLTAGDFSQVQKLVLMK
jgi:hypothetical protein